MIGQTINHPRLGKCVIIKIHRAGTIDVEDANGRCWRITGLHLINNNSQEKA